MTPRLTSSMLASALVRRVNAEGGAAVVVAKGDPTAGAILLICLEKGKLTAFRERVLDSNGRYSWAEVGPSGDSESAESAAWLQRRRQRDPDLWLIELDIAQAERFAAETSGDG
jgi:hypothetical protein